MEKMGDAFSREDNYFFFPSCAPTIHWIKRTLLLDINIAFEGLEYYKDINIT